MNRLLYILFAVLAFCSCTQETYESGDGDYSYLRQDFCEINTDDKGNFSFFVTDDEATFTIKNPYSADDIKSDTTYRALVTYDYDESMNVRLRGVRWIGVAKPHTLKMGESMKTDPVGVESIWLSSNGKYINLALLIKTGVSTSQDDDSEIAKQEIGIMKDSGTPSVGADVTLRLHHAQNGVPEYYTQKSYISIPTTSLKGKTVNLIINTYDGIYTKTIYVN